MKRARTSGGSVTGGTGDIKPQWLTLDSGFTPAFSQYAVANVNLPVPRFGTLKTKATIMEILRVEWFLGLDDEADVNNTKWGFLSTNSIRITGSAATFAGMANDARETTALAFARMTRTNIGGVGGQTDSGPISLDMTDGNGNGILIAVDKIFVNYAEIAGATLSSGTCKLLYRLVNVGITEYVGIVQSQQA